MQEADDMPTQTGGLVGWMDRKFFPGVANFWDDLAFRNYILSHVKEDHVMLDIGAGAGIVKEMHFRGLVKSVAGLDPDPRVLENPHLDDAKIGYGESIDWPDETFDIVIADNVLEHLERPAEVFAEIARVLKPGGRFMFKTPNKWHYMPLIATATPHWFHQFYNKIRGRDSVDTFETHYRANRPADVVRNAAPSGLEPVEFVLLESRPEYLRVMSVAYLFGILYQRLVTSTDALKNFRVVLIGHLKKSG
ncbi:class I SAM-dependent methyltransferase [uncultured Hoeflea sp.]|uniref:class I SAM-dependent methyltransferase n=1 Tax=uncultured Hoeflea sp. TaxID=538666 RepID=UPI0031F31630